MKRISEMTTEQLVERFTAIALDQYKALQNYDTARYNRLFDRMDAVKQELKARNGDQRRALLSLYKHPNTQVRFKAAVATLAVAPTEARAILGEIAATHNDMQGFDARHTLNELDSGVFKPT
jgi:uncharacterized protein DUF2019